MDPGTTTSGVGILPAGALGVALFHHLGGGSRMPPVRFIARRGSIRGSGHPLVIVGEDGSRSVTTANHHRPDLLGCHESGWLPELLLVCTQPDQLLAVVADYVTLLERLYASHGLPAALVRLPVLILCSNGIYHERVRRFLVELLEEAMLYGRLPDLWSDAMGHVVGKLLRGVTIQTGYREGTGTDAIFHPGPAARTTLAGGDPAVRRHGAELLRDLGGWFEAAESEPPVRVEFDKALINLWGNLLGQLKAIDESGAFRLLKVREIFPISGCAAMRELAQHVFAVGRAVRAYRDDEDFKEIYEAAYAAAAAPREHVPSSLKWLEAQLAAGTCNPQLSPTEDWLLEPLVRYAQAAGLDPAVRYFTLLRETVEARLAVAVSARSQLVTSFSI